MAQGLELSAQRAEVVDLPVVRNGHLAVLARHRLVACVREIEDGEAGMGESDLPGLASAGERCGPHPEIVGSTVAQGPTHGPELGRTGALRRPQHS